jgi:hypothetical protein
VLSAAFVEAPAQSHVGAELVGALAGGLAGNGVAVQRCTDGFPLPRDGLAYVLVSPSEYFERRPGHPPDFLLHRTVLVCTEPPGSPGWENEAASARAAGAVFATSALSARELRRRGVPARHLALGRVPDWEPPPGAGRDVDVSFAGAVSPHRSEVLARAAGALSGYRCELEVWDQWRLPYSPGATELAARPRVERLARARVALSLPYAEADAWDDLLAVQAAHAGAALLCQGTAGSGDWTPGTHFAAAAPGELGPRAVALLEDPDARATLCAAARDRLDALPTLAEAAGTLAQAAQDVARRQWSSQPAGFRPGDRLFSVPGRDPAPPPPLSVTDDPRESRTLLERKRAVLHDVAAARRDAAGEVVERHRSPAWDDAAPRVSILTSLYDYADRIATALDSVAASTFAGFELVVVDDASGDASLERTHDWMGDHPDVPALLIGHTDNRGVASARNAALALARGELALILDADNALYPRGLERLVAALDADPGAAFAYGLLERFSDEGPLGLGNVGPWDPAYLRTINYVDALALIRVEALRELEGYTDDLRLHGWEDYDLWCAMAERGARGAWVPEVVARYRVSPKSMLRSVTEISNTDAFAALMERHPRLMAGLEPPL